MTELKSENFESAVSSAKKCLVDFYATWCGPCKAMNPVLESVETELGSDLIYKIDVDKNRDLVEKLGIRSVPTFIFFENGLEVERKTGSIAKNYLIESLT
jgi:thioredoxin 1